MCVNCCGPGGRRGMSSLSWAASLPGGEVLSEACVALSCGPVPLGESRSRERRTWVWGMRRAGIRLPWCISSFVSSSAPSLLICWCCGAALGLFPNSGQGWELQRVSAGLLGWLIPRPRVVIADQALRGRVWWGCSPASCPGHCTVALRPLRCLSQCVLLCAPVISRGC